MPMPASLGSVVGPIMPFANVLASWNRNRVSTTGEFAPHPHDWHWLFSACTWVSTGIAESAAGSSVHAAVVAMIATAAALLHLLMCPPGASTTVPETRHVACRIKKRSGPDL